MKKTIHILLLLLVTFHAAFSQQERNTDTTDTEAIRQKAKGMMRELFMFEMAADVLETRQLISDNQLGDSVELFMSHYNNALFFKSTLDYDFFWNSVLGRKKYKVPSSKLFLDSKEKYLRNNEPAGSIDFDIVLTPQWEDPQTENTLKNYKVEITAGNYTNLSFTSEQQKHFNSTLNDDLDETCATPRAAEVNEAIFKGLAELRRLLSEAQKPVDIGLDIHFEGYPEQSFGFDKLTYDVHKPSYQRHTYNGKKMLLPWKSMASSGTDKVLVEISGEDSRFKPGDVQFMSAGGGRLSATKHKDSDSQFLLNLNGKTAQQTEEIQAYVDFRIDEENTRRIPLGGLNTISYDQQQVNLVIVPVNGSVPFTAVEFTSKLNEIYKQAVVNWQVSVDEVFNAGADVWDKDGDDKLNDGESTFLSNYSDEQKKLIRAYKKQRDVEKRTYYAFILNAIPSKSGLEGYMPLKSQYAFIHTANKENAARLIAHELGHGAFRLWHTFSSESSYFMAEGASDNLMDYNDNGTRLHKYQWDFIHNPEGGLYVFQDEEEGAMEADEFQQLLQILSYSGVNTFAFGIKCETEISDGNSFYVNGYRYYIFSYTYNEQQTININQVTSEDFPSQELYSSVNVPDFVIPSEMDKLLILNKEVNSTIVPFLCDVAEDYPNACSVDNLEDIEGFYDKLGSDISNCIIENGLNPAVELSLEEINGILLDLQTYARENQQFEFKHGGVVHRLNSQNQLETLEAPESNQAINAGLWEDNSIEMKMRLSYNTDGILQFEALGIHKDLPLAEGKTASLTEISANMLAKNNALLKEYQVKDIKATLNSVGANLDSEVFPEGKKVAIDKESTFIKILCEAGGVGLSFLKTAEIEQPVYLENQENIIKAPPICTGSLEGGAMAVTDITSMVTMIYDLVTDKEARAQAKDGFKAIGTQIKDEPAILFPILGEIVLQEITGSDSQGFKDLLNSETNEGRRGHLISKTTVRTTVSVVASAKFITQLPDMAVKMAAKMPKAKLWLRFRNISDDLAESLLTKFDELADGGNKFLDDFVDASDETLNKFLNNPELIDAWKKMDNLGADEAIRRNSGALEVLDLKAKGEFDKIPDPSDYLDADYISNHLAKFDEGAVRFTTDAYPTLGSKEAFVMPKSEFDDLMSKTGGDLSLIEKELALTEGTLTGDNAVIALIKKEDFTDIKMPKGTEGGADAHKWIPGGKTANGGWSEAVMDLSNPNIPKTLFPF